MQTPYLFFPASDAGSELYLSTNEKPDSKSKISYVDGGFATYPFEFDRWDKSSINFSVIASFFRNVSPTLHRLEGSGYLQVAVFVFKLPTLTCEWAVENPLESPAVSVDSYPVAIYLFLGCEKIGVRLRRARTHEKGRKKSFPSSLPFRLIWDQDCCT